VTARRSSVESTGTPGTMTALVVAIITPVVSPGAGGAGAAAGSDVSAPIAAHAYQVGCHSSGKHVSTRGSAYNDRRQQTISMRERSSNR
jgi:hypothetical protein